MIVFPKIASIRRIEHARLQELVPLLEMMPGGFNQARLMHMAVQVGLLAENEQNLNQPRVRRAVQHFLEIGYLKRDESSDTWYFPDLAVIEADRKEADILVEKQREQHARLSKGWAVAGDALIAAYNGTADPAPRKSGGRTLKPEVKLGRFKKK